MSVQYIITMPVQYVSTIYQYNMSVYVSSTYWFIIKKYCIYSNWYTVCVLCGLAASRVGVPL
jgi:hypothetical protein